MAWMAPQVAMADCDLEFLGPDYIDARAGETVQFAFRVGDTPDFPECTGATGSIEIKFDGTGGAILNPTGWSAAPGETVNFSVTLGPDSQTSVSGYVNCSDCGMGMSTLYFYAYAVPDYDLQLQQAALLQAQPGETITLNASLSINGKPAMEDYVCWEVANADNGAAFTNGEILCKSKGNPGNRGPRGSFIVGPEVGTFVSGGQTSVNLNVGAASPQPLQILVYPYGDMTEMASITIGTMPTMSAVSPQFIEVQTGDSFQVQVRTENVDGTPSSGNSISFLSNAAPELSPASQTQLTDGSGLASATFTATAGGFYPAGISAVLDPTPTAPESGDEILLNFDVAANDLIEMVSDSGDGQVAQPNEPFPMPLAVLVTSNGEPLPDAPVTWQVVSGSATLASPGTVGTDGNGRSEVSITAGPVPGPVQVRAYLEGGAGTGASGKGSINGGILEVFYNLTVQDQTVRTLRMPATGAGNLQSGAPGATLAPLVAEALDSGSPASGVLVNWSVLEGSALLSASQTITGANGRTQVDVTLGQQTGPVRIQAVRSDEEGAVLVYQLNAVNVDQLTVLSGHTQNAQSDSEGEPLVVRFSRNGAPFAGQTVSWEVLAGDAVVDPGSSTTDIQGQASTGISFGPEGGSVVVQASAGDAAPVQFNITVSGGSGPPPIGLSLAMVSGENQAGAPGSRLDLPLVVIARDSDGEPLAGVPVGWRVLSGAAQLDAVETDTGEDGQAQMGLRFLQQPGAVVIRASAYSDLVFVDFTAEAFAPDVSVVSGSGQRGVPGQPLQQDFVVAIAQPVAAAKSLEGTQVNWTIIEGDGTLEAPTTGTDAQGQARNRLTLGSSTGTYRVRAQVPGGSAAEFTAVAGGDGALEIVSGDGQTLPTETFSQPLEVVLRDAAGAPVAGVTLEWQGDNAEVEAATTTTDAQGRSSNRARVLLPGAASVTVSTDDVEAQTQVFRLNAGVINTDGLAEEEREVADAVDQLCPALANLAARTPEQEDLLARCLELVDNSGDDPDGVADALGEMLQDVALTQVNAALLTTGAQFDNLKARIAALRSGARGFSVAGLNLAASGGVLPMSLLQAEGEGGEVGADFGRWGFFASGTIGRGKVDANSNSPRYDFDTAGLTAGVDYRFSDRWILGGALGISRQDNEVANDRGKVDTDGWSVSAYSTWFNDRNWYVDGVLTWGANDYEMERRIRYDLVGADGSMSSVDQVASADSDGNQLSLAVSFGRDFQRGAWNFGPYFRGTWTRVDFDEYAEELLADRPGSGLGLLVDARDITSATGVLGGKLTYTSSRDWGILMPHLSVEWEHEFKDDPQAVVLRFIHDPTQTPIVIAGDPMDTDYFNVGVGLSALFPGGKSGFVYYEHLVGASGVSQGNLAVGLRIEF